MDSDLAAVVRILRELDTIRVDHYQPDGSAFVLIEGTATVAAEDAHAYSNGSSPATN